MRKILPIILLLTTTTALQAQTVKKVVLEYFAGGWCQTCPNGAKAVEDMDATHGEKFIAIAVHNKDGFDIDDGDSVDLAFDVTTYPAASIDRKEYSGKYPVTTGSTGSSWKTKVSSKISEAAIASVGFDNLKQVNDSTYEGDVIVKFTSAPAAGVPINVNVCLLENKIEAKKYLGTKWGNIDITQKNSTTHYGHDGSGWTYTSTASSGNTFYYQHTLRAMLGGPWGWSGVIPTSPTIGTDYKKHFSFTVSATDGFPIPWKTNNMEIVAYASYNGALAADRKEIINAERVTMSAFKSSNVKEVVLNANFLKTYPNPAYVGDVLNIEYSIASSSMVTMNVYNTTGQLVAQPYISDDSRGIHTIFWHPLDNDIAPGVYFIEISTTDSRTIQRVVLH